MSLTPKLQKEIGKLGVSSYLREFVFLWVELMGVFMEINVKLSIRLFCLSIFLLFIFSGPAFSQIKGLGDMLDEAVRNKYIKVKKSGHSGKDLVGKLNDQGLSDLKSQKYLSARNNFSKVLKISPRGVFSRVGLGITFYLDRNYENAVNEFKSAFREDQESAFICFLFFFKMNFIDFTNEEKRINEILDNLIIEFPDSYLLYCVKVVISEDNPKLSKMYLNKAFELGKDRLFFFFFCFGALAGESEDDPDNKELLSRLEEIEPGLFYLFKSLNLFFEDGEVEKAKAELDKSFKYGEVDLKITPALSFFKDASYLLKIFLRGRISFAEKHYLEASNDFSVVISEIKRKGFEKVSSIELSDLYILYIDSLLKLGKMESAVSKWQDFKRNNSETNFKFKVGCSFLENKYFDFALKLFNECLSENSSNFYALYKIGQVFDGKSDHENALKYFDLAILKLKFYFIQTNQDNDSSSFLPNYEYLYLSKIYFLKALIWFKQGKFDLGSIEIFNSIELFPDLNKRGESHAERLRYYHYFGEEQEILSKLFLFYGKYFLKKNEFESAFKYFQLSIKVNENNYLSYFYSASCLVIQDKNQEALEYIDYYSYFFPNNTDVHFVKAKIFVNKNDFFSALKEINLSIQGPRDSSNFRFYFYRTLIIILSQDFEKSLIEIEENIKFLSGVDPQSPEILKFIFLRGYVYERLGLKDLSKNDFKNVENNSIFSYMANFKNFRTENDIKIFLKKQIFFIPED